MIQRTKTTKPKVRRGKAKPITLRTLRNRVEELCERVDDLTGAQVGDSATVAEAKSIRDYVRNMGPAYSALTGRVATLERTIGHATETARLDLSRAAEQARIDSAAFRARWSGAGLARKRDADTESGDERCPAVLATAGGVTRSCRWVAGHDGEHQVFVRGKEWGYAEGVQDEEASCEGQP